MFRWYGYSGGAGSMGLLVLRLVVGAALTCHGASKIHDETGWKINNATTWMDKFPSPPPPYLQAAAVVAEFGGGIALVIGFLTPLFSLMIACTMAVAAFTVHIPKGDPFVNLKGGPSFELAAAYFAVAVCLLLVGPGQFSLDYCLFGRRRSAASVPPYAAR
jgi:putative oxidoreductase